MEQLNENISKYYPVGVSYFSGKYEGTEEYKLLMSILDREDKAWNDFIESCIKEFGTESVDDRTNREPGHLLLLHVKVESSRYVIVWYVARILNTYCFRVQPIKDNEIFPDFFNESQKVWDISPVETKQTTDRLLQITMQHFPGYTLFQKELDEIVPLVSTHVRDLGEATFLNVIFSNFSY